MDLEIPDFLRVTPEDAAERRAAWVANPPRPVINNVKQVANADPEVSAFAARLKEESLAKENARLARLSARKKEVSSGSVLRHLEHRMTQTNYDRVLAEIAQLCMPQPWRDECAAHFAAKFPVGTLLSGPVAGLNTEKEKAPRPKKAKSPEQLVRRLNFMRECADLKLSSVDPASVIGATALWAFNVKTRRLTEYCAVSSSGLSVNGSAVIRFDEAKSSVKTLRESLVAKTLSSVMTGTRPVLKTLMAELRTTPSVPNGRVNRDTLLLRTIR